MPARKNVTWQQDARQRITLIMVQHPNATRKEMARIISDAYPYGPRENFPYKAWLKAQRAALSARYNSEWGDTMELPIFNTDGNNGQ